MIKDDAFTMLQDYERVEEMLDCKTAKYYKDSNGNYFLSPNDDYRNLIAIAITEQNQDRGFVADYDLVESLQKLNFMKQ